MRSERIAAHADESCEHDNGDFYVQYVMEKEVGHTPSRQKFPTLADAQASAAAFNTRANLTVEDVLAIRLSSHAKSKARR